MKNFAEIELPYGAYRPVGQPLRATVTREVVEAALIEMNAPLPKPPYVPQGGDIVEVFASGDRYLVPFAQSGISSSYTEIIDCRQGHRYRYRPSDLTLIYRAGKRV